jgi:hypothetical protein
MAKVGFVGLTWMDKSGRKQKTKFRWADEAAKVVGAGAAVALQKAALEVRRNTQRMMVGGSTPAGRKLLANPRWWKVGERDGIPVLAFVRKVPREDKVSSWSPKAFLRNDVQADFDASRGTVVIGPSKAPWLNQLHECGGTVSVYVHHGKYPVKKFAGHDVPKKFQPSSFYYATVDGKRKRQKTYKGAYVGVFSNSRPAYLGFNVGHRTVNGRGYMEIGLQASLHKIPAEFRNKLGQGKIKVFREKSFRS